MPKLVWIFDFISRVQLSLSWNTLPYLSSFVIYLSKNKTIKLFSIIKKPKNTIKSFSLSLRICVIYPTLNFKHNFFLNKKKQTIAFVAHLSSSLFGVDYYFVIAQYFELIETHGDLLLRRRQKRHFTSMSSDSGKQVIHCK